ncbi:MAG TPA: NAD(P)/FAD-dependent oxidoreductase, partial [Candidatus Eisenbacteria bacterium]|nr:NAD(P)/FAD-dependent oxidoreductase [Candidatus Eisenbacteria bacterium]
MKVLIDGAGLAGLVLAGFLKQGGVDVTIIEQAPHYKHMGYGIALWPLGKRVLGKLNLLEKLDEVGSPIYNTHMMDTKGKHIYKLDFSAIEKMYGKAVGIPRATLHSMVINRVGDLHTKFNTKVEKLKQHDNIVTVTFNNGNEENFDLVVGADGIRSQIRSEIFTDTDVDYYGISCWIAWAKAPPHVSADTGIFRIFLGNGSYMCFFPVGNNEFVTYLFTPAAKKY